MDAAGLTDAGDADVGDADAGAATEPWRMPPVRQQRITPESLENGRNLSRFRRLELLDVDGHSFPDRRPFSDCIGVRLCGHDAGVL
jgi:hypothetical protein